MLTPFSLALSLFPWLLNPETYKSKHMQKEPRPSDGSSLIMLPRSKRLLININPPNQSHAQKTLDEETQGREGSLNFFLLHLEN